ncbi:pyrophosphate--fructose 6-phosphate 1-phosphotransferase [Verrucomicrobiota bacterium]|nr:pyrophosphate--fructose 6-phosphate 1-phosphotransferase [Verrucomicrobiota bacterium]GDY17329.1 pyrophosphate--fructose 6-phosphate 1-phosphotransferase [Verrucomicrobiota bacterium]
MSSLQGNLLVAQSGGPTPVINASLAGVIAEALNHEDDIPEIYGALNGIQGVLNENLVDLAAESQQTLRALHHTPGAALGTCRYKVKKAEDLDRILQVFEAHNIRYFHYIGGNDSQDTAAKIDALAKERGYELRVIGVPKTIDNDMPLTDHSPGFGSVAKHIALTVREMSLDNAAMGQNDFVSVLEVMGRNAGWLAASSVLAHRRDKSDDKQVKNTHYTCAAPHIVLLPEVPFNADNFIKRVEEVLKSNGHCFVVVSEGVQDEAGNYLGADTSSTDAFGHAVLGGAGESLRNLVEERFSGVKARASKLGIAQRSASHSASKTDVDEAFLCGGEAVKAAVAGESGKMVILTRSEKENYAVKTMLAPLTEIANGVKAFPDKWIGEDRMSIHPDFVRYALPLIQGELQLPYEQGLPRYAQLSAIRVQRRLEKFVSA